MFKILKEKNSMRRTTLIDTNFFALAYTNKLEPEVSLVRTKTLQKVLLLNLFLPIFLCIESTGREAWGLVLVETIKEQNFKEHISEHIKLLIILF